MEQTNNYLVFQCYGHEGIFHECAYALLSLSLLYKGGTLPSNLQVWIYTDKPEWFDLLMGIPLPLHCRPVDSATIKQWRGKIDFVHRMKIEVLKDFTHDRHGNILYVDTDVVFTRPIDDMLRNIAGGKLYMHVMEGIVSDKANPILAKLNDHLQEHVPMEVNGVHIHDLAMWNAGVLGFNTKYRYLLDDVLAFTDNEYPRFPKHIIEQFAFSVYFQQEADVKAAAPYILHYWNLKEARAVLASFFSYFTGIGAAELAGYSMLVQMHVLMQEKMNFAHNRSVMGKLLKNEWQPPKYDWPVLMKQL